ncbi:hypothetical protein L1887_32765 [Cichorium endivia]|nr:hypothetical protein L1887_32765 [Cichorium endivia]
MCTAQYYASCRDSGHIAKVTTTVASLDGSTRRVIAYSSLDDEDSILCAKDLDPRKDESVEPTEKADVKKVFIRSRL